MKFLRLKILVSSTIIAITPLSMIYLNDLYIFHTSPLASPSLTQELLKTSSLMKTNHSSHPLVYSVKSETGELFVVKQTRPLSLKTKIISKLLIAHEYSILQALQDVPNVTHLVGKIDNDAFCMKYIPSIKKPDLNVEEAKFVKTKLTNIVNSLHEKNVCFLDLCTSNVLFSPDLSPHIIDFGSSIKLDPLLKRVIGPYLYRKDHIHLLKLMFWIAPHSLTFEELQKLLTYYEGKFLRKKKDPFIQEIHNHIKKNF